MMLKMTEVDVVHRSGTALTDDLILNAFAVLNPLTRNDEHEVVE